ncbi:hypothetical protein Tco_0237179 [Tanacetum coccineum]
MVYVVNGVLASGVDMVLEKDLVGFALQEVEIHPLMFLTLSMILQTFSPTLHNPSTNHTHVNYVGMTLIMVMIVHYGSRLSMSRNRATIKTLVIIIIHKIHQVFHNNIFAMKTVGYSIDHQEDLNQQRISDVHDRSDKLEESHNELLNMLQSFYEMVIQQKQVANISNHTTEPSRRFNSFYDDDDYEESTIPSNEIVSQILLSIAITPVLPTLEPADSLIMGDENLSTIPEKESDEVIKSSVEDLVLIPSESKDISDNESECDLPFCDDSPPLDVLGGKFMTLSNPLFDDNDDFTSSDDEEDVQEENFKIYSNPLFEFDDEYISSNVNPLFDEVLEDIESKDSYVSNLDELALLVTPLSNANEDECFNPGGEIDEIDAFLVIDISTDIENGYHNSEGDIIYLKSLLIDATISNLPLEVFLDHDPNNLKDKPDNEYLKSMVKVFDLPIHEKFFSPTYVSLPFEDRHYLSLTYVI